jgi:hypothetical protein
MLRKTQSARELLLIFLLAAGCLSLRPDAGVRKALSERMNRLPRKTLWVWERPEDLRQIDPATTAIAWLDQTLLIGRQITVEPRRQSIIYPGAVQRIAVVRIEVQPGAELSGESGQKIEHAIVDRILESARKPGIAALQIDFDARRSERGFYAGLLGDLRSRMPEGLPLSMTALASWCSYDDWIAHLPVDEAVPMFFRMEPDRRMAPQDRPEFRIREPLCSGSVGISTREHWPNGSAGKRIYIFADRGWHEDMHLLAARRLP